MTEAKQRALDVLDVLYTERRITEEEHAALTAGVQIEEQQKEDFTHAC